MQLMYRIGWKLKKIFYNVQSDYTHTQERVCPDFDDEVFRNHFKVYEFALQFISRRTVLDVGCGTGYGSSFLASHGAAAVEAIDYSQQAIAYARKHYRDAHLRFQEMVASLAIRF